MIKARLARLALGAALVISVPVVAVAQDEAVSPEGVEWHLAGYAADGEVGNVPWYIDATLLLEDGDCGDGALGHEFDALRESSLSLYRRVVRIDSQATIH